MSGLLQQPTRRSKAAIQREKEELMKRIQELEQEEKCIDPVTEFASMRGDILFVNFSKIRVDNLGMDYECDHVVPDRREGGPTYFRANGDECYSDAEDDDDCYIDKAIARCKENAKLYNKMIEFFEDAKQRGAKYIVDSDDVDPGDFEMEK